MSQRFDFTVNGKPVSVTLDNEDTPLLDVLRNALGLMGTRFGCGLEQCGCCMVLIDGQPEKACAGRCVAVAGKSGHHHRRARHGGKAAPAAAGVPRRAGRAMRLLPVGHLDLGQGAARQKSVRRPAREIAEALDGNICRCGSHNRILRAVEQAAAAHAGEPAHERSRAPLPGPLDRQSEPRPLGRVSRARPGGDLHRPRRIRPGRAHRHGADRRRRTRRRAGAHHGPFRRHRAARPTKAIPPAASRCSSAAWRCGRPAPTCARCSSRRPRASSAATARELAIRDGEILRNGRPPARTTGRLPPRSNLARRCERRGRTQAGGRRRRSSARAARALDLPAKVFGERDFHPRHGARPA